MCILRSLCLSLVFSSLPLAAQVEAYHGATGVEHQAHFDNWSAQGYRMIALSIYGSTGDPRYAAVWINRAGPDFAGFHGLTGPEYQAFVDTWWPQGYRPRILTATGSSGDPRFAGVYELTNAPGSAAHGLTEPQFWAARTAARALGQKVTAVDIYNTGASPRYIVGFGPVDDGQGVSVATSDSNFQEHFDAWSEGHNWPFLIGFNDDDRYVSVWRSSNIGSWVAHHDMTGQEYQDFTDLYALSNWYPITVQASGSGSGTRFAAAWAASDVPLAKQWTATGMGLPMMSPFDAWAQNWMSANDIPAASLAIVKDCRLVYARGYTLAPKGYPITQPTDRFAVASCTKPITSIAVHQAFENPGVLLNPTDPMMNFFGNTPADGNVGLIDVHALLTHQGGWNRNVSPDPMVGQDKNIADALGISLPIDKTDIFDFMIDTQALDFVPYSDSQYSNFGFSVLGQILENRYNGIPYGTIVQRNIFTPLGITRAQLGGSLWPELLPNEVLYHVYTPGINRSPFDDSRPWLSNQYGWLNEQNMDSHGGWVMAAADFAKILAAFDLGAANPILGQTETNNMWTDDPNFNGTMRGWFRKSVDDGKGGTVNMAHHNGRLIGTTSFVAKRMDGLSFVFFTNGDQNNLFGNVHGEQLSDIANTISIWPNHDLFPSVDLPPFKTYSKGFAANLGGGCRGPLGKAGFDIAGTWDPGQAMSFNIDNAQSMQPAVVFVGLQPDFIALDPIGMPGCSLRLKPLRILAGATNAAGEAVIPWVIPDVPELVGDVLFAQAAVVDPGANALGLTSTDTYEIFLGGWQ